MILIKAGQHINEMMSVAANFFLRICYGKIFL